MAAAVNEVTNRVYVVNYGSSDVTVIDGVSNRPIATVKVGLWPQQIAINTKTNTIYVVNTHANSVSVIDGRTNTVAATVPADKGPWAVAVDPVSQHDLRRQPSERQGHRDRWAHQQGRAALNDGPRGFLYGFTPANRLSHLRDRVPGPVHRPPGRSSFRTGRRDQVGAQAGRR